MSSSEILNDRAAANDIDVKALRVISTPSSARTRVAQTPAMAEAIVSLGYPLMRYLAQEGQNNRCEDISAIFTRMRSCYYQNRDEFFALKPLLEKKVAALGNATIRVIAKYAEGFVPMWATPAKASEPLKRLQKA